MNYYKKIIRNPELRGKILELLEFVPDSLMVKAQYLVKTGNRLNLTNPRRYTEKIQWYKLNYHDPKITICSDKYTVRDYVENKGFGEYLNELYGVYDRVEEINFRDLPNSFAIKVTTGSGTNIFITDKSRMDENAVRKQLSKWINRAIRVMEGNGIL